MLSFDADATDDVCDEYFAVLRNFLRFLARASLRHMIHAASGETQVISEPSGSPELAPDAPNLVERILVMRRCWAFSNASVAALAEMAQDLESLEFAAGDKLWSEGGDSDHCLLISSGLVMCSVPDGGYFEIGAPNVLGLSEALAEEPRWCEARASTRVRALRLEAEPFVDILEDHFLMARQLLASMAARLLDFQRDQLSRGGA